MSRRLVPVFLAGCALALTAGAAAAPLRLVPVGDGRTLYLSCRGTGSPTVLFESGLGVYSGTWLDVQRRVSKTARACIYDRAGLGQSSRVEPGTRRLCAYRAQRG